MVAADIQLVAAIDKSCQRGATAACSWAVEAGFACSWAIQACLKEGFPEEEDGTAAAAEEVCYQKDLRRNRSHRQLADSGNFEVAGFERSCSDAE